MSTEVAFTTAVASCPGVKPSSSAASRVITATTRVDSVVIRWPSGNLQVEEHVPIDRYFLVRERVEETR